MKNYKSSIHRLAHLFKKGRDLWKNRAVERQKKLKTLQIKVRDLSTSRDNWKQRAKVAESKLQEVEKQTETHLETSSDNSIALTGEFIPADEYSTSIPARHQNPVYIIQLAVEQFIVSLNSLRGCQSTFELFAKFFNIPIPSFSNIRNWILRAGLYQLLQTQKHHHNDWIFILDMTIQLGTTKCLIILGIRKSHLKELLSQQDFKGLKHIDVVTLSIEILFSTKGTVIEQCLDKLSEKVGIPVQIISDHGSDIKKGIELFAEKHPEIIYTYDITHYMALLFKAELETDERYQSFLKHCSETRSLIQQTQLKPLLPPPQRTKSRYFNVGELIEWGTFILNYAAKEDFSAINSQWNLESDSYKLLKAQVNDKAYNELKSFVNQTYQSQQDFEIALNTIGLNNQERQVVCDSANLGQKYFNQKLGWILEYQDDIQVYSKMVDLVHIAEKQLSHHGISQDSLATFNTNTEILTPRLENFKSCIDDYLKEESSKIPPNEILWANSNVIESIFGKYKLFMEKSPLQEVSKLILIIPLCTIEISGQFIKNAMETVSIRYVEWWTESVFGKSSLSKKRAMLRSISEDTKTG